MNLNIETQKDTPQEYSKKPTEKPTSKPKKGFLELQERLEKTQKQDISIPKESTEIHTEESAEHEPFPETPTPEEYKAEAQVLLSYFNDFLLSNKDMPHAEKAEKALEIAREIAQGIHSIEADTDALRKNNADSKESKELFWKYDEAKAELYDHIEKLTNPDNDYIATTPLSEQPEKSEKSETKEILIKDIIKGKIASKKFAEEKKQVLDALVNSHEEISEEIFKKIEESPEKEFILNELTLSFTEAAAYDSLLNEFMDDINAIAEAKPQKADEEDPITNEELTGLAPEKLQEYIDQFKEFDSFAELLGDMDESLFSEESQEMLTEYKALLKEYTDKSKKLIAEAEKNLGFLEEGEEAIDSIYENSDSLSNFISGGNYSGGSSGGKKAQAPQKSKKNQKGQPFLGKLIDLYFDLIGFKK